VAKGVTYTSRVAQTAPVERTSRSWRRTRGGETLTATVHFLACSLDFRDPIVAARSPLRDFGALCPYAGATVYRKGYAPAFDLVPLAPRARCASSAFRPTDIADDLFNDIDTFRRRPTAATHVDVFHPLLTTDGPLQLIDDDGVVAYVDAIRIERLRPGDMSGMWADLVRTSMMDATVATAEEWYARFYTRRGAERR